MRYQRTLAASVVLIAALLMIAVSVASGEDTAGQTHAGGADELAVTWVSARGGLRVSGLGFRPRSTVSIRVGSQETQQAQVDDLGAVRIEVPLDPATVGREGTSVIVSGRSASGAARTLVAASPPRAAGHGPSDLIPWSVGLALIVAVLIAVPTRKLSKLARAGRGTRHTEGK